MYKFYTLLIFWIILIAKHMLHYGEYTVKLNKIALVLAMSGISGTLLAQDAQDTSTKQDSVERISVTGSSIKRTNYEGDLPLTIITKDDIDAAGITSAEQLMLQLNIASNSNDN